jgi:transcriptional regulator with XRE-family HTH domain
MALGARIRQYRVERNLSGKELAAAAEVSPSLISQIENEITTPSIDVMRRIAKALQVAVGNFFDDVGEMPPRNGATPHRPLVIRKNARKKLILPTSNWVYELLTPDLQGRLEVLWLEIGPNSGQEDYSIHEGEECDLVVKGRVHIWVEDEEYIWEEGDSLTFETARPHRVVNREQATAIIISAVTPPAF